jgi:hypothetical protein
MRFEREQLCFFGSGLVYDTWNAKIKLEKHTKELFSNIEKNKSKHVDIKSQRKRKVIRG